MKLTILLTGASKGIGKALYQILVDQGHHVIGTARHIRKDQDHLHICDVNDTSRLKEILEEENVFSLNVVIHNAAIGYYGNFDKQDSKSIQDLFQTNLEAPIILTHALHPYMLNAVQKNQPAKVIFVSSSHARESTPLFAVYTTTKAGLNGFARSLQREWASYNIKVLLISVGPTKTTMHSEIGVHLPSSSKYTFMKEGYVAKRIALAVNNIKKDGSMTIGSLSWWFQLKGRFVNASRILTPNVNKELCQSNDERSFHHILITGAGGGIGQELVHQCKGKVVAADLPTMLSKMNENETIEVKVPLDLTCIENIKQVAQDIPSLHGVIMNAGLNIVGRFTDIPIEDHIKVLRVNLEGPVLLLNELMHQKKLNDSFWCVVLSSLSYFVGYPGACSYSAAKDGIASFANSLGFTTVFPGPTQTQMAMACSPDGKSSHRMKPSYVAKKILSGGMGRKTFVIPGFFNSVMALFGEMFPNVSCYFMKKIIYDKLKPGELLQTRSYTLKEVNPVGS